MQVRWTFIEKGNPRGLSTRKEWKESAVPIDLPGLSAILLLWLCGCFVAFLVFVLEVVKEVELLKPVNVMLILFTYF